jgi:MtaA/CmuA family methyltransferase
MEPMSSRERMRTALAGGTPDQVPVFLRDLTLGLDVAGYSTPEVCAGRFDAEKSSRAVIAAQRALGHDAVVGSIQFCGLEVAPLGGKLHFPELGIPTVTDPPFRTAEDIDSAELPDPYRTAPLANVLRSYQLTADSIGDDVAILGNLEGPITKAGILRGLETLLMDMLVDRRLAEKTVRFATGLGIDLVQALAESGVNSAIFVAAASDNPDLIGPDAFRSTSLPSLKKIVLEAGRSGLPTVFHPHGVFTDRSNHCLVDESIEQGICGFQFAEKNDFAMAKKEWGDRVCILGGVDVSTTLLLGPEERVKKETEQYLTACSPGGGYVMMCSCSVHRGIPSNNLKAMIDTCRRSHHRERER